MASTQTQPISNVVHVDILLETTPAQGQNIDTMLIVGPSTVIDVTQRMRTYSSIAGVAGDFASTDPEYLAAVLWFAQRPQPLTVNIGRWAKTAAAAVLVGAPLTAAQQLLANWTAIVTGAFGTVIDGKPVAVTAVDLHLVTNLNAVATVLQTRLLAATPVAAPVGTTVVWNAIDSNFKLTNGTTGATSTLSFLTSPHSVGFATFAAQPANNDTITLNGTTITFVAAAPVGSQVQIGASLTATLAALLAFCQASADAQLVKFTYSVVGSGFYVTAVVGGAAGDVLTLAKVSANITLSGATLSGGTGVDISTQLGMASTSSGAYVSQGIVAESALSAVQILDNLYSNQWYGLSVLGAVNADYLAIADYIEAASIRHYHACTSQEGAVISAVDTTSLPYLLKAGGYDRSMCQYSSFSPYAAVSYMARILTTNWNGNNTTITEMFKQEPTVTGENLSVSQMAALLSKNCNVFIKYNNGTTIIQPGMSASGQFTDTIVGVDWFAIKLQTDVYNLLYTSNKIPQSDEGMHIIGTVIESDCLAAVNNGLFAPGTWTLPGFGAIKYGDFLAKGFYVYQPPIALQSPADRARRLSVPFQIAAKLAGAVHEAVLSVTVNQ